MLVKNEGFVDLVDPFITGFYDDRWYTKLAPLSIRSSQADVVIDKSSEDWVPQQVSQTMSNMGVSENVVYP